MPKTPKNRGKPANACIFMETADHADHRGITAEHVWPQWQDELFPRDLSSNACHMQRLIDVKGKGNVLTLAMRGTDHRGPAASKKLRVACVNCNGGWMSMIETAGKQIMVELIGGTCKSISVEQQLDLCRWVMLKAIVSEFTDPATMAISLSDRMYLKNNRSVPPTRWKIWIGQFLGGDPQYSRSYSHTGTAAIKMGEVVPDGIACNEQSTTFVFGELMMYATSSATGLVEHNSPDRSLVQIWPPLGHEIPWPPALPLGDDQVEKISNSLLSRAMIESPEKIAHVKTCPSFLGFFERIPPARKLDNGN